MNRDAPSETALRIAGNKLAALRDPVLRRIVSDPDEPYTERFVRAHSRRARFLLRVWRFGPTRSLIYRMSERMMPGGPMHLLLRKRYFAETVRTAVSEGAEQMVVFGGGLDPLTLLVGAEFPGLTCFELDHPATQAPKRRALESAGALPSNLVLIPVDFARERAEERLRSAPGFRANVRTVWIAEGLLMYLEQSEVDHLFGAVRRNCAPGSRFLFTMVDAGPLKDPNSAVSAMARMCERLGEPIRSSIERKRIDGYLRKHGFRQRALADHRTLRAAYLDPLGIDRKVVEGELLVLAQAE